MVVVGVVLIPIGQGACAGPDRYGYPHSCSLQTLGVDSAEADKVGSHGTLPESPQLYYFKIRYPRPV